MPVDADYEALEDLGRVRLSRSFFMRDFLYSETANHFRLRNVPDNVGLAIEVGRLLCEEVLEPLQDTHRAALDDRRLRRRDGLARGRLVDP